MTPLLSPEGRAELHRLANTRTLFAFDFDGTLAPIVSDPGAARADDAVLAKVEALALRVPVAVISGRSCADLERRAPKAVRYLIGNHGNEGLPAGPDPRELKRVVDEWKRVLERQLVADAAGGVVLEDKGFSLSLHYRSASNPQQALSRLQSLVARLQPGPEIIAGKMVLNLLPPGSVTKFEALQALVAREAADGVFFIGDDVTDEVVFARAPVHWTTVRVEPTADSQARYSLSDQREISDLLDAIAAALRRHA